ncbi:MAG: hypothetical protein WBO37_01520 [Gammaproteobacteria bacterium]
MPDFLYSLPIQGYAQDIVRMRMKQFLLVLITVALAAAPLRGSFAMPEPATADETGHCAHMQDGMQGMSHADGGHDSIGDAPAHDCSQGCTGDCCDGACGTCVHASIALPAATAGRAKHYSSILSVPGTHRFTGCALHPPFRPPIILS